MGAKSLSSGGLVAGVFLGIGLALLSFVRGAALSGLFWVGLVILFISLAFATDTSARLLICTVAAIISCGLLAYFAARSEVTGNGFYYVPRGRGFAALAVTRDVAPDKFREGTNMKWALSILLAGIGTTTFMLRRKLESSDFP